MSLKPPETIQKTLLSTTSRFVGEYESDDLLLSFAWSGVADGRAFLRQEEGPASRTAVMAVFRTSPPQKGERMLDPAWIGEVLCSCMSVLYGKRFDNHGLVEDRGSFLYPDLTHFGGIVNSILPINSHAVRRDFPVPLNLSEFSRFNSIFSEDLLPGPKFMGTFAAATRFYRKALTGFETDPEGAYLHLITAGEILSNHSTFEKEALLDEQAREILRTIRSELDDGEAIARTIESRWMVIKRRFVKAIASYADNAFFERTEAKGQLSALDPASFEQSIAAAYDLRSKHLHAGVHFGAWVSPKGNGNWEKQMGQSMMEDKSLAKILLRAPTLIGLERVIRYCLLRFAESEGAYVAPLPIVETGLGASMPG